MIGSGSKPNAIPVGAKLAGEDGGTVNIDVARHTAIASRLTPTGDLWRAQNVCTPGPNCRSEPARDGARSANITAT
ncbi:hypothetical protein C1X44_15125 [Pseudomonas sp. MPR-AND1A]|nr:hypothetical protein C1X44_15125 [Pseudomonas sp. MPR-AND1A]